MFSLGLKIFIGATAIYAGVRMTGVAIEWIKEGVEEMRPHNVKRKF